MMLSPKKLDILCLTVIVIITVLCGSLVVSLGTKKQRQVKEENALISKKIKDLRMLLLGIKAEYRNRGVDAILFEEGYKGVRKGGYRRVEFSWILEDNIPVQRLVEMIGGRLYKKYRIYEKRI